MPSTFTWLDTSEHERRRAMEVIDLFSRQNTRDELGIGAVRDAIADLMAPGVSTIQTRAKYFLLIPWIYLRLERLGVGSAEIAWRARKDELRAARALARGPDPSGAIGIEAGKDLKRLPSSVYWGGLGTWGIRLFSGSVDQYHRSLDRFHRGQRVSSELREDPEAQIFHGANWHPHVPEAPKDFLDRVAFNLSPEEGLYLQDRIQTRVPGSLVAFLAQRPEPWDPVDFPWDEPLFSIYPPKLQNLVNHARCFSEVMHGAALLYNLMLAEAVPREDLIESYRQRVARWQALIGERLDDFGAWDRDEFWALVDRESARISIPTRSFVTRWIDLALSETGASDARFGSDVQREVLRAQESFLKRGRARLLHREYLQMWGGDSGTGQLDYRWGVAQTTLRDILRGLAGAVDDADAA